MDKTATTQGPPFSFDGGVTWHGCGRADEVQERAWAVRCAGSLE